MAKTNWKYHHLGVPTEKSITGEKYLKDYKLYHFGFEESEFGIEWIRYENECWLPKIVKEKPHLAFEVKNLREALIGRKIIIEPNSPSEGNIVAFIEEDNMPIELIQIIEKENDFSIRNAEKRDIDRITEIALFTNRFNFNNILSNSFLYDTISYDYIHNRVIDSFSKLNYYVLEENKVIIGYLSMDFSKNIENECDLINIAIDVPFQNKNNGKKLLDYCFKIVKEKEINFIKLEVIKNNIKAVKFYGKYGFKLQKEYFSNELNQNIMEYKKEI